MGIKYAGNVAYVKGDVETAPTGAEPTGEYVNWGGKNRRVFRETKQTYKKVQVKGPDGQPMFKRGAGGQTLAVIHTISVPDKSIEREFILDDLGNGQTVKVYTFREDPAEIARKEREARKRRALDRLLDNPEVIEALLDEDKPAKAKGKSA